MLDIKIVRKRQTDYPEVFKAINRFFLPAAGVIVLAEAQRRVPTKTSRLKGSLHYRVNSSKGQVRVGTNVHYAPHVEYGHKIHRVFGPQRKQSFSITRNTKNNQTEVAAQPYLRPALDTNRKKLVKLWADTYNNVFAILGGRG